MARKHRFESEGLEHLYERYVGASKRKRASFDQELAGFDIARKLYELRKGAGLTQAQLAKAVETSTSVISRLEDASYEGHSLTMLRRIAATLGKRVQIEFVEPPRKRPTARKRAGRKKRTEAA